MPKKKAGKTVVETRFDELCPRPSCQPYGEYQITVPKPKRKYAKRKPPIEKRLSLRPTPKQQEKRA